MDYRWYMNAGILEPIWLGGPTLPDNSFEPVSAQIDIEPESK